MAKKTLSKQEVSFDNQDNGYDISQVDRYIDVLTAAYQTAYDEYISVSEKYNALLENCKNMNVQKPPQYRPAEITVTKSMTETEILEQKIMAAANAAAEQAKFEMFAETEKLHATPLSN
jgi:cell division septum initiation protein DivIVA